MATNDSTIRQFRVGFPEAEVAELRRRVHVTRRPKRETVTDDSQRARLALMQELALLGDRLRLGQVRKAPTNS